jgi:hypothetical protein
MYATSERRIKVHKDDFSAVEKEAKTAQELEAERKAADAAASGSSLPSSAGAAGASFGKKHVAPNTGYTFLTEVLLVYALQFVCSHPTPLSRCPSAF